MNYSPWIRWHLSWPSSKRTKNFQGWKVSKQTRCWPYSRMTSHGEVNLTVKDTWMPQFRAFCLCRNRYRTSWHPFSANPFISSNFRRLGSASDCSRCWWKGILVIRKQVECLIRKKLLHHVCSHFHINPSSKQFPRMKNTRSGERWNAR